MADARAVWPHEPGPALHAVDPQRRERPKPGDRRSDARAGHSEPAAMPRRVTLSPRRAGTSDQPGAEGAKPSPPA